MRDITESDQRGNPHALAVGFADLFPFGLGQNRTFRSYVSQSVVPLPSVVSDSPLPNVTITLGSTHRD